MANTWQQIFTHEMIVHSHVRACALKRIKDQNNLDTPNAIVCTTEWALFPSACEVWSTCSWWTFSCLVGRFFYFLYFILPFFFQQVQFLLTLPNLVIKKTPFSFFTFPLGRNLLDGTLRGAFPAVEESALLTPSSS